MCVCVRLALTPIASIFGWPNDKTNYVPVISIACFTTRIDIVSSIRRSDIHKGIITTHSECMQRILIPIILLLCRIRVCVCVHIALTIMLYVPKCFIQITSSSTFHETKKKKKRTKKEKRNINQVSAARRRRICIF